MENILTLWDIDGNLVNVYSHHTPAYQKTFMEIFGLKTSVELIEETYGLPAWDVITNPLRKSGIDEETIKKKYSQLMDTYFKHISESMNKEDSSSIVLPGIVPLLEKLRLMDIPMGIVTGNLKRTGEAILRAGRLIEYFDHDIRSYGDVEKERAQIVKNAIESAKKKGLVNDSTKIFVFGDTPSDVKAAKANNCISIAVIKNSKEEDSSPGGEEYKKRKALLEDANPDYLVDDYTDTEQILSILSGKG